MTFLKRKDSEMIQMLELALEVFKVTIITMLSDAKESILIMNDNIGNLSREIEFLKRTKWEF